MIILADVVGATYPAGAQPCGGTRTMSEPTSIQTKYRMPIVSIVAATPFEVGVE